MNKYKIGDIVREVSTGASYIVTSIEYSINKQDYCYECKHKDRKVYRYEKSLTYLTSNVVTNNLIYDMQVQVNQTKNSLQEFENVINNLIPVYHFDDKE